ncbi:MAG TPA: 4Fe-4S dicluster domain-containing protein [Pyrodictiaceae archaeon]|nr:4Fe-4S dicluster domain-containing protein [Pyrodictiaceae archaeon]
MRGIWRRGRPRAPKPHSCWALALQVNVLCRVVVKEIRIDYSKCSKCRLCIEYCPVNVFEDKGDGRPKPEKISACIACIGCMAVCEPGAIELVSDWECSG